MSDQTLFEKLDLKDEKNLLIQGIPSTIEKQFIKLSFAKCVTPLLKVKKIDFALVFAVSKRQLCDILKDITPILQPDPKLWIAYPKLTSKIASDLNRDCNWDMIDCLGFQSIGEIAIDNVWTAVRFKRDAKTSVKENASRVNLSGLEISKSSINVPEELKVISKRAKSSDVGFNGLSPTKKEWNGGTKQPGSKLKSPAPILEKLSAPKKTPVSR